MSSDTDPRPDGRETIIGWSALGGSALAVLAWAACCVLPVALSLAGLSLAGTALVAGQRTWITLGAAIVLVAGWWSVWQRRRACAVGASCTPPSRLTVTLLTIATLLTVMALIWQPLIEPRALMLLRSLRG
jgi:mercuric ion transport protein